MTGIMEKVTDKKFFEEAKVKIKELSKRSNDLERDLPQINWSARQKNSSKNRKPVLRNMKQLIGKP
jgi:hypothetical protein